MIKAATSCIEVQLYGAGLRCLHDFHPPSAERIFLEYPPVLTSGFTSLVASGDIILTRRDVGSGMTGNHENNMFITKQFSEGDLERGLLDPWLNSLVDKEHGMMIVGYAILPGTGMLPNRLLVTVKGWKRSETFEVRAAVPATIDQIPQDPSIDYGEEEE